MIARSSIEEFENQKSDSWDWIKELSKKEMLEELHDITPKFKFKTKPDKHQLAAFIVGMYNPQFLFLLDMGLGKSKITIDLIKYWKTKRRAKRTLVLVPSPVSISSFADEIRKHSNMSCIELYGTSNDRWNLLETVEVDFYIVNYSGMNYMLCDKEKEETSARLVPSPKLVERFSNKFDSMICDEIHYCKSPKSLTYRLSMMISRDYSIRYGLTGTPMGRDPMDLWSQFHIIDNGETLGRNITLYRETFFNVKVNYWGGYEYKFIKSKEKALRDRLTNKSLRYKETEVEELPPLVYRKIEFKLSNEAQGYYNTIVKGLVKVKGNYTEIDAIFVRLRQICSGFLQHKLDDEKILIDFNYNPKLETLMTFLESVPETSKIVIFHEFIHSGKLIAKELERNKYKFERLYGETKDKKGAKDRFLTDKKCKIFLVNNQSGGTSLNLQVANYVFYYESSVSPIVRKQTWKRVHRRGQTKHTFFYDLIAKNSVEQKILDYLEEGKNIFKALVEGKVKL